MPLATTFAGDSARAEGLFSTISLGQSYWVATLTDNSATHNTIGRGITTDSSGNVYVCGSGYNSFNATVASVSKYDSSGTIQWQRTITDASSSPLTYNMAITVDSSNYVYVCGYGQDVANLTLSVVYKYDNSGTLQWQRTLTGSSGFGVNNCGITTDSSGNIYICGANGNAFNLIYKLNSSGTLQWQRKLDDGQSPKFKSALFQSIAIDSSGNLYVCGNNYNSSAFTTISVSKYNSSGTIQWQRSLTDTYSSPADFAYGISLDSSANVYVCGTGLVSANQTIGSISKWNSSGTLQWQNTFTDIYGVVSGTPSTFLRSVFVDSSSNVFVVGNGKNSSGQNVISISKWNSSGTIQFQRTITDTNSTPSDGSYSINVDSLGNMYVCGTIKNTANQTVAFIAKLPSDGSRTGTYSNSTFGIVYVSSSWAAATSTWTTATTTYSDQAGSLSEATSTWTDAASAWTTSLVVV